MAQTDAQRAQTLLGLAIKKYRTLIGFSQEELAEAAELHRTYIGDIERGTRNVGLQNIVKISKALGISASELLKTVK